jgi:UDP-N-acetylmuramyl pentapeptide synthase
VRNKARLIGRQVLKVLSKLVIEKHKPTIIGIIGSGETSIAREVLYTVLSQAHPTRRNLESPLVEFSLPLTIIGALDYPTTFFKWIFLTAKTLWQIVTVKPYHHFLVLEMSPATPLTLSYWLDITNPNLVVICGEIPTEFPADKYKTFEIKESSIVEIKNKALEVGEVFAVEPESAREALKKINFYPTRIRFFPGINGKFIVDATYYYYPIKIDSVVELVESLPGKKLIITNESIKPLPENFELTSSADLTKIEDFSVIIVRGKRSDKFELLEALTQGNYE